MFSTDLMESRQERVAINGVEPQMIGMLVSYAYTAEVVISKANVQALLAAANLLDVMAVREACCRFMERQMDEMNCVGIHCFAEAHSCPELERRSMEYIQQHFSTVSQQVSLTAGALHFRWATAGPCQGQKWTFPATGTHFTMFMSIPLKISTESAKKKKCV